MKAATVRELRNDFPKIEAWIHEGESINISKRGRVIATLIPAPVGTDSGSGRSKVDIMARLRETWGEKVYTPEEVAKLRADERADDPG